MPNYIFNMLEILGTEEQVCQIREFIKGEPDEDGSEMYIDFEKIIKMPDEFLVASSRHAEIIQFLLFGTEDYVYEIEESQNWLKRFGANLPNSEFELALKLQANYEKFGYSSGYYWRLGNWGTKWNAFNQTSQSNSVIIFDTAWNEVLKLILRLSEIFEDVTFKYSYHDFWRIYDGYELYQSEVKNGKILDNNLDDFICIAATKPKSNINKLGAIDKVNNIGCVDISIGSIDNLNPEQEKYIIFDDMFDFISEEDEYNDLLVADRINGEDLVEPYYDVESEIKQNSIAYVVEVTFYDLQEFIDGLFTYAELPNEEVYLIYENLIVYRNSDNLIGEEYCVFDSSIEDRNHSYFEVGNRLDQNEVKNLIIDYLMSNKYTKNEDNSCKSQVDRPLKFQYLKSLKPGIDMYFLKDVDFLSDQDLSDTFELANFSKFDEIMDLFWEAECQQCTDPLYGRYFDFYDDFEEILNDRYPSEGGSIQVKSIEYGEIFIEKYNGPLRNTYTIFDKTINNDEAESLIIGKCIEHENVSLIIDNYVESTNRRSILKNFKNDNIAVCWED